MKRFFSIMLVLAMLFSLCPAAIAEDAAAVESGAALPEEAKEQNEEADSSSNLNINELGLEENQTEEENAEEQNSPMLEEDGISLMATSSTDDEVSYSTDNGSTWTASTLVGAVSAIGSGTGTIKVLKDITVSSEIEINGNITLVADSADVTIKRADSFVGVKGLYGNDTRAHLFSVADGATLTLGSEEIQNNLIIDGGAVWPDIYPDKAVNDGPYKSVDDDKSNNTGLKSTGCLIVNNGTLNMYNGAILQNNHNITEYDYAGTAVINHATFNMYGGKIWKNSSFSVDGSAGAVANGVEKKTVYNNSVFNMFGGEISYNAAGIGAAVTVGNADAHTSRAKFNMSGGLITKNYTAGNYVDAGNIYINKNSECEITGGKIIENEALTTDAGYGIGGAIYCCGSLKFSGGIIENNKANYAGDDIFIATASGTVGKATLASQVEIEGKRYSVSYCFDGYKDGNNANRYDEANKDVLATLTEYSNECGSKAVYEEIEPEVEYVYHEQPGYVEKTARGTLVEALEKVNNTGDSITLLKDVELNQTITMNNAWTLQSAEGEQFTLKRAAGFKDVMILNAPQYKPIIRNIILDGNNEENAKPILEVTANCDLNNVVFRNNKSADKGGAIYLDANSSTTSVELTADNVTIENCSALYGGAVYIGNTKSSDVKLNNCKFLNNTADSGSAIYADFGNVWATVKLNGCEFSGNKFVNSESNTENKSKRTVVFATSSEISSSQHIYLWGNTKFANDETTVSDIMLGGSLAQSTEFCNLAAHDSSNFTAVKNVGSAPIRVALETFITGYFPQKVISLIEEFSATDLKNSFKLVAASGQTLPEGYTFLRRGSEHGRYATVKKPSYARTLYNSKTANIKEQKTAAKFKNATKNAIDIETDMIEDEGSDYVQGLYGTATLACETEEYYVKAKANNAKISSISMQYTADGTTTTVDGTVNPDGTEATLNILPDTLSVVINGGAIDINVYVEYEVLAQDITIASVIGGTISTTPTGSANVGSTVTLNAVANAEYDFGAWNVYKTGDKNTKVTVSGNSFVMPAYPVTVSASFVKKQHQANITIEPTEGGSVTIDKTLPITVGETVNVKAVANEHWELSALTMNGADILSTKSFTMPNENVEIRATFVKSKFNVKVSIEEEHADGGTIDCSDNGKQVEWGKNVDFTVKPNKYYDIDKVLVNGEEKTPDENGNVSFSAATQENVISATFKKKQFTLTDSTAEANGTVSITKGNEDVNAQKLDWGTPITVSIQPKEHWEIESVKIGGKDISEFESQQYETLSLFAAAAPTTYSILVPTYNADLVVTYKKIQYTVAVNAAENGSVSFVGAAGASLTLDWDNRVTFTVNPNTHYELNTLTVSGASGSITPDYESASGTYSFTMPTENVQISATFKKVKYSLTTSGANVTFTPNSGSYEWGTTVTLSAVADEWFEITDMNAAGTVITENSDGTYSFEMPTGNLTVTATAIRPTYNITFESQGGSAVSQATVLRGETITKPNVPTWTNRGFAGWYRDSGCTQKYDFETNVTGNVKLYARWFIWGDVNGDGKADSFDALQINRCYVKLNDLNNLAVPMAARVSGADKVRPDSFDALLINRHYVRYIDVYPVEISAAGYEFDLENNTYIAK